MGAPESLVITRGLTRRMDDASAARHLGRSPDSNALLLDLSLESTRVERGTDRLDELLRAINEEAAVADERVVPLLPHAGPTADRLAVVHVKVRGRAAMVSVQSVGVLMSAWPVSIAQATSDTVLSVVRRNAQQASERCDWGAFATAVSDELAGLNALLVSRVLEDVTRTARRAFDETSQTPAVRRKVFEQILDTRSRMHEVIAHLQAAGLKDSAIVSELQNATSACDALTASLAGMAAVVMQEQGAIRAAENNARDRAATQRDRDVARLAAALLLPGLWFAFLGANVFPTKLFGWSVQSDAAVIVALTGGALLAIAGWFLIPLIFRRPRSDKRT